MDHRITMGQKHCIVTLYYYYMSTYLGLIKYLCFWAVVVGEAKKKHLCKIISITTLFLPQISCEHSKYELFN